MFFFQIVQFFTNRNVFLFRFFFFLCFLRICFDAKKEQISNDSGRGPPPFRCVFTRCLSTRRVFNRCLFFVVYLPVVYLPIAYLPVASLPVASLPVVYLPVIYLSVIFK